MTREKRRRRKKKKKRERATNVKEGENEKKYVCVCARAHLWRPRKYFSRLPGAAQDTNDYRIFGVNAEYEHRSSCENNLNGPMREGRGATVTFFILCQRIRRQARSSSPFSGHLSAPRFQEGWRFLRFAHHRAVKSANLSGTFERIVHLFHFSRNFTFLNAPLMFYTRSPNIYIYAMKNTYHPVNLLITTRLLIHVTITRHFSLSSRELYVHALCSNVY